MFSELRLNADGNRKALRLAQKAAKLMPAMHSGVQMMGGRFRSVMPSDLFKPGAMARESLRAPGRDYASTINREELQRLMRRYQCCTTWHALVAAFLIGLSNAHSKQCLYYDTHS